MPAPGSALLLHVQHSCQMSSDLGCTCTWLQRKRTGAGAPYWGKWEVKWMETMEKAQPQGQELQGQELDWATQWG